MYIDLHSHMDMLDADAAVKNAQDAGLKAAVTCGINPDSNRKALEYAEKYSIVKCTIGLYPIDAMRTELKGRYEVDIDAELEYIEQNRDSIIGIGEIGLDYKTGSDREGQAALFRRQLDLAKKLKKPVIIHSRKAEADALEVLSNYNMPIVLHCFSGKKKLVHAAIDKKYYFTIPTSVVRSEQYRYLAEQVPLDRLFCETDSPFMSPFRQKPNEPAFVVESYREIARIRQMDIKEVSNIIYNNFQRVFL